MNIENNNIDYDIYNIKNKKGKYIQVYQMAIIDELTRQGNIKFCDGIPYIYKDDCWICDKKGIYVKHEIRKYIAYDLLSFNGARRVNSVYALMKIQSDLQVDRSFLEDLKIKYLGFQEDFNKEIAEKIAINERVTASKLDMHSSCKFYRYCRDCLMLEKVGKHYIRVR